MKVSLLKRLLLTVSSVSVLASGAYADEILYQETFPFSPNGDQQSELRVQGWCGGNGADPVCANRPTDPSPPADNDGGEGGVSVSPGSTVTTPQDVNNNPVKPAGFTDSFAFFSQTRIGPNGFMVTEEYPVNASLLTAVQWDQRTGPGDCTTTVHFAIRIGSNWYVSNTGFPGTTDWAPYSIDLTAATFFQLPAPGVPGEWPGAGLPPGSLSLPDGVIDAFGVYWNSAKSCTHRIDNFILMGTELPPPPPLESVPALNQWTATLLAGLLLALAVIGMRRRA
jgi:hypothetical protein